MFATPEFQQFLKALRCEFYKLPKADRESNPHDRQRALERNKQQARRIIKDASGVQRDGWLHHMIAKEEYWLDLIEDLLQAEHDPNVEAPDGNTALDLALQKSVDIRWVGTLLRRGANFGRKTREEGWWTLASSYQSGAERSFQALVRLLHAAQEGILQQTNVQGQNALDWYFSEDRPPEEIEVLIQVGLQLRQPKRSIDEALSRRPLSQRSLAWLRVAVRAGLSLEHWSQLPAHERFMLRFAQPLLASTTRTSPLFEALIHQDQVKALDILRARSEANQRLTDETTPLMLALYPAPLMSVVHALLDAGQNINACRNDGLTALMVLCASSAGSYQIEALRVLLRKGASIDASEPEEEMTPLLFALRSRGSLDKIKILIEHGASLAPERSDEKTARDFAREAGIDLSPLLQSAQRQCLAKITQDTTSYHAEEIIRGELELSSLFDDLGVLSFTIRAEWRPVRSQEWRRSHAEEFSGSMEVKANEKKSIPFSLRAPAGPISGDMGVAMHEWRLYVGVNSPQNITMLQRGHPNFTLSRATEDVGPVSARDREIESGDHPKLTRHRPSKGEHIFTHEDYELRLTLERELYQIGERLRGVVIIESREKISCTKHEVLLQQYVLDLKTGKRTKMTTLIPQIEFESPWYQEQGCWPKESQTKCIFSLDLPMLTPSYDGERFLIEWVVLFEAHIPWAINPTVCRRVTITESQQPPEERPIEQPALIWPKDAAGRWYSRKKPTKKRWEELGVRISLSSGHPLRNEQITLSLSCRPSGEHHIKEVKATLLAAERDSAESYFETAKLKAWRSDPRSLASNIHLSGSSPLVLEERFLIPPDAPTSLTSAQWCFSWWILVELLFSEDEPIQVALLLDVLPAMGAGAPFRS